MTDLPILKKARIAVAVSGGGRSLANLVEASKTKNWEVSAVISSNPACKANEIAKIEGIPLFMGEFSRTADDGMVAMIFDFLHANEIEWIVLAGFLKRFPSLPNFHQRIINIHPALLPKFGGKGMYGQKVHKAVLESNETQSGATVHFVNDQYDEGDIISQIKVDVQLTDSVESLAAKVFAAECILLVWTFDRLVSKDLPRSDKQVSICPERFF